MYGIEEQPVGISKKENSRWHSIDIVRGITLISMILYHVIYDLVYIWNININWFESYLGTIWQQSICCTFIVISGLSWQLRRKHFKSGVLVYCCGILISAITALVMPQERIIYGILTFIGVMILLMIPISRLLKKIDYRAGLIIFLALFLLTYQVGEKRIGFFSWTLAIPDIVYDCGWFTFLGFPSPKFSSSDYFPLIPWMFLYITGYYLFFAIQKINDCKLLKIRLPFLNYIGRNTLLIYMAHQPIIYMVLYFWFEIC